MILQPFEIQTEAAQEYATLPITGDWWRGWLSGPQHDIDDLMDYFERLSVLVQEADDD